jgi:hypothetical protein
VKNTICRARRCFTLSFLSVDFTPSPVLPEVGGGFLVLMNKLAGSALRLNTCASEGFAVRGLLIGLSNDFTLSGVLTLDGVVSLLPTLGTCKLEN